MPDDTRPEPRDKRDTPSAIGRRPDRQSPRRYPGRTDAAEEHYHARREGVRPRLLDAKDETIETQPTTDVRLIPAVTGLAILLVLVIAFAGNHAPDLSPDKLEADDTVQPLEEEPEPETSSSGAGKAGLVIVALAIVMALAAVKVLTAKQLIRMVGVGVAVILAVLALAPFFQVEEFPVVETSSDPLEIEEQTRAQGRDGIGAWWLIAAASVALGVAGMALRRSRPAIGPLEAQLVSEAVRLTLADIDTITDDRLAIITAYARFEGLLTDAGLARDRSETSREYFGRVLGELVSDARPIEELGRLYEHARYDAAPVSVEQRRAAVAALRSIEAGAAAKVSG